MSNEVKAVSVMVIAKDKAKALARTDSKEWNSVILKDFTEETQAEQLTELHEIRRILERGFSYDKLYISVSVKYTLHDPLFMSFRHERGTESVTMTYNEESTIELPWAPAYATIIGFFAHSLAQYEAK